MDKHFELTSESKVNNFGVTLYRIKSIKDSLHVKKGELGGWVESLDNLSDEAWIGDEAEVFGNAKVLDNVRVFGNAVVYGNAIVFGDATVYGNGRVYNNARVYGYAKVLGSASVYGYANVFDNANVYGYSCVFGNAYVLGNTRIYDDASVFGNAYLYGNGLIGSNNDYCYFMNFGSRNRSTTFFKTKDNEIYVKCGCFENNIEQFEKQVIETHGDNKFAEEYLTMIKLAKIKLK